jgi:hypothetical protein
MRTKDALAAVPDIKYSQKKDFGAKENGMKVSYMKWKGKKIELEFGVSPVLYENSPELIYTQWGVNVYQGKDANDQSGQNNTAASWGGAPPPVLQNLNGGELTPQDSEASLPAKRNLDFAIVPGSDSHKLVEAFHESLLVECENRSEEWFKKKFSRETLDDKFKKSAQLTEEGDIFSLKTKVDVRYLKVFNMDSSRVIKECSYKDIQKDSFFKATVVPSYIWFQSAGTFGIRWTTTQVLIYGMTIKPALNFHMDDEEDYVMGDAEPSSAAEPSNAAAPEVQQQNESSVEIDLKEQMFNTNASRFLNLDS